MKTIYLIATTLLLTCASAFGQGEWQFQMTRPNDGPTIRFKNTTLTVGGSFVCVNPAWTTQYFWMFKYPYKLQRKPKEVLITSDPKKPTDFFVDQFKFKAISPTSVSISVDGSLRKDHVAIIEYIPLVFPASLMEGARVENEQGQSMTIGNTTSSFLQESKRLVMTTQYGKITLTVKKGAGLTLVDRRNKPYKGRKSFLCMVVTKKKLTRNDRFSHEITMTVANNFKGLGSVPELPSLKPKGGKVSSLPSVKFTPAPTAATLFPQPKQIALTQGMITFPTLTGISVRDFPNASGYVVLLNELFETLGIDRTAKKQTRGFITVKKINPEAPNQYDYYEIDVTPQGVTIGSATPQGVYYALSTLAQMVDAHGKLRTGTVKDWADFEFRGIHLLADQAGLKLHSSFIKHVLGPLKINQIIYECEYVKWPSHPEIHTPWGMTTQDMKKLIKVANDHFMQINPLLQSYGHSDYLFRGKVNLDLAEDPATPYVYNVSNPRTYQVMGELLRDVRTVFPMAKFLHIGHDEVALRGRYPYRPENIGVSLATLLQKDLDFYQTYAKNQNISLMLWQDYINGRSHPERRDELFEVAKKLDKSTAITVWDYTPKKEFPEILPFVKLGLPVIGATGEENIHNIINYSRYAKQQKIYGMLHTTWTGHGGNAVALFKYTKKLWPYVQAGVSFWNTQSPAVDYYTPSAATRMFQRVVSDLYPRRYFPNFNTLSPLDLSAIANASLAEPNGFVPGILTTPYNMIFSLPATQKDAAGVLVKAGTSLTLPVGKNTKAISFLYTILDNNPVMKTVGNISIHADQNITQPLIVRREIGNIVQKLLLPGGIESGQILTSKSRDEVYAVAQPVFSAGGKFVLWQFDLDTKNQLVKSITLTASPKASLVLAGVTLIK